MAIENLADRRFGRLVARRISPIKDGWSITCSLMIPVSPHQFTEDKEHTAMFAKNIKKLNGLKF